MLGPEGGTLGVRKMNIGFLAREITTRRRHPNKFVRHINNASVLDQMRELGIAGTKVNWEIPLTSRRDEVTDLRIRVPAIRGGLQ